MLYLIIIIVVVVVVVVIVTYRDIILYHIRTSL